MFGSQFRDRRERDNDRAANDAEMRNAITLRFGRMKFKVGQEVMLRGRERVRIVAAEPAGFISSPGRWGYYGRWCPAIVSDNEIYRYVHLGPGYGSCIGMGWHGQTTGDELSVIPPSVSLAESHRAVSASTTEGSRG